jgi:hypothetical protein
MKRNAGRRTRAALEHSADTSKLVSLLALAAGAVAMPQTSEADIIYTNLGSGVTVGFGTGSGSSFVFNGLPGNAAFGFATHHQTVTTGVGTRYYRTVTVGRIGTVPARVQGFGGLANPRDKGALWNATNLSLYYVLSVAWASDGRHSPNNYDHKYLAWEFQDPSHAWRYGWIELGVANRNIVGMTGGPDVTIYGYAWDNSGVPIPMGAVPEPGSASLLALGALAFGARGVRSWRRNRPGGTAQ